MMRKTVIGAGLVLAVAMVAPAAAIASAASVSSPATVTSRAAESAAQMPTGDGLTILAVWAGVGVIGLVAGLVRVFTLGRSRELAATTDVSVTGAATA